MMRLRFGWTILTLVLASGCDCARPSKGEDAGVDAGVDAGEGLTCRLCMTDSECGVAGACVQYGSDDFCGKHCSAATDCAADEACLMATSSDGKQVQVCEPKIGGCGSPTCGTCAAGTTCDVGTGSCVPIVDSGVPSGICGTRVPPTTPSCCHSCNPDAGNCQPNGCYGGWWCDLASASSCYCKPPPASCSGDPDAGAFDAGTFDGGPLTGGVGPDGGAVSRLYFAVVGDTRPGNPDDTASYPTAVISKIYADIQAMDPRPQFVLTTGDYMFAAPGGTQGVAQMGLYLSAAQQFTGPIFADLGNHECTGYTASNCAQTPTSNFNAFMAALVTPLGQSKPYYTINFTSNGTDSWTAKLIVIACNAWDPAQQTWLQSELAKQTTYTFVSRHEPGGVQAPCVSEVDAMLQQNPYNLLIVGHAHSYSHFGRQLTVGNGGAPISGSTPFGYATIEQQPGIGFRVLQYDSATALPISGFVVP